MNFTFRQELGYLYDLIYIFSLYFNREYHIKNETSSYNEEVALRINQICKDFGPIPDELHVFFALKPNGRGFLSSCYFAKFINSCVEEYDFKSLLNELMDHNKLICNLISFYFPDLENDAYEYKNRLDKLSLHIDSSEYDEIIKRKIYSFLVNPDQCIQKLIFEFIAKEALLSSYYKDNYRTILEMQVKISDPSNLLSQISDALKIDISILPEELYWSCCLLNRHFIWAHGDSSIKVLLLGSEYEDFLMNFSDGAKNINLRELGEVLSEANRIEILNFILEHGEATTKDLEKNLKFSSSTTYYHLTLMQRTGIINARTCGRWILYSINKDYFASIVRQLQKFII